MCAWCWFHVDSTFLKFQSLLSANSRAERCVPAVSKVLQNHLTHISPCLLPRKKHKATFAELVDALGT